MRVNLWIRRENEAEWEKIENKSAWINERLQKPGTIGKVEGVVVDKIKEPLLSIPTIELASEAKCKGTHFMSRADCGKKDCPWAGIK